MLNIINTNKLVSTDSLRWYAGSSVRDPEIAKGDLGYSLTERKGEIVIRSNDTGREYTIPSWKVENYYHPENGTKVLFKLDDLMKVVKNFSTDGSLAYIASHYKDAIDLTGRFELRESGVAGRLD